MTRVYLTERLTDEAVALIAGAVVLLDVEQAERVDRHDLAVVPVRLVEGFAAGEHQDILLIGETRAERGGELVPALVVVALGARGRHLGDTEAQARVHARDDHRGYEEAAETARSEAEVRVSAGMVGQSAEDV